METVQKLQQNSFFFSLQKMKIKFDFNSQYPSYQQHFLSSFSFHELSPMLLCNKMNSFQCVFSYYFAIEIGHFIQIHKKQDNVFFFILCGTTDSYTNEKKMSYSIIKQKRCFLYLLSNQSPSYLRVENKKKKIIANA